MSSKTRFPSSGIRIASLFSVEVETVAQWQKEPWNETESQMFSQRRQCTEYDKTDGTIIKDFWDERYRHSDFVYGDQPNVYFAEKLAELTPAKTLFPAEGEGRNAVYAATQGFEVEAFDQSQEGQKKAMKLAEKESVKINYTTVSADTISYEKESFDLLVMVFAHFPETLRRNLQRQFSSLVKNGVKNIDFKSVQGQVVSGSFA